MSTGLQALYDAAQIIERCGSNPLLFADIVNGETHHLRHLTTSESFDLFGHHNNNNSSSNNNNNSSNNNNNNIISTRAAPRAVVVTTNGGGQHQVSSSAPASSATFQHATTSNGLTISNGGSQLIAAAAAAAANHQQRLNSNEFEYRNGNDRASVTVVATAPPAVSTPATISNGLSVSVASSVPGGATVGATNGRASEGRLTEDAFSSTNAPHSIVSPKSNSNTIHVLSAALSTHENKLQLQKQQQQQLALLATQSQQHEPASQPDSLPSPQHPLSQQSHINNNNNIIINNNNNNNNSKLKLLRPAMEGAAGPLATAAASKQMLLNDGKRIASTAATIGSPLSRAINIPKVSQSTLYNNNSPTTAAAAPHSLPRYKAASPLTPPPAPSRKVEPHSRIRSFSLSSYKIPASQLHMHNSELSPMIVEDGCPISYVAANGAHSPPRGNPYLQMMTQHQGSTASQVPHVIGGSGRRRTISSNSNGAGTRETHNKLEKNRRAHLKECYEQLRHELPLKDEDRKKTSNLVILGEALKYVQNLKKQQHDVETEADNLGSQKINLQMKLKNLKRDLGPLYEKIFGPDTDTGNEREIINDNTSLLSSRGSILYSSSSSLSSGGSNGSNTLSSPVGSGMQTAMPTTISPVITKLNNSNSSITNTTVAATAAQFNGNGSTSITMVTASPNSAVQQQQQHLKTSASASANNSPAGSPTNNISLNGVININSTPLSLTAKNISAMSQQTRASPTPSTTPLPSPSSSSCISSSSSSLISSSPPMAPNGVINGRNVMLSIPTSLKLTSGGAGTGATIGNGTASAAATIIATAGPANGGTANNNNARVIAAVTGANTTASNHSKSGSNNNNISSNSSPLATMTATTTMATIAASAINNAYRAHAPPLAHSRKTSLSISIDEAKKHEATGQSHGSDTRSYEDGEQPAKFIKVFNGLVTTGANENAAKQLPAISMVPINNAIGQLQLSQVVGGGSLVVSPTYIAAAARTLAAHPQHGPQKLLLNGSANLHNGHSNENGHGNAVSNNELGRLPGGAELNILPATALNGNSNGSSGTGLKINGAFYHANGKLTLVNGGINNGIVLKDGPNNTAAALTPLIVTTGPSMATATTNGAGNGMHYTTNFAQLLAANAANNNNNRSDMANAATAERTNGKHSL